MPRRVVVCGPPDSGKELYVASHAAEHSLIWDFDAMVSATNVNRRFFSIEQLPVDYVRILSTMRDALVIWLSLRPGLTMDVFLIVENQLLAARIAAICDAELIVMEAGTWKATTSTATI